MAQVIALDNGRAVIGNFRGCHKPYHISGRRKSIAALRDTGLIGAILVRGESGRFVLAGILARRFRGEGLVESVTQNFLFSAWAWGFRPRPKFWCHFYRR